MSDRCGVLDVALRAWALSCRGLGAGADCGLLLWRLPCCSLLLYDCGLGGARLKCLRTSRPGAWRLCCIAILLKMACFRFFVCLEPFDYTESSVTNRTRN